MLDRGVAEQDLLHRRAHFPRALQCRPVGQRQRADDVALILGWDESAGHGPEQQGIDAEDAHEREERDDAVACRGAHAGEIEARESREGAVERREEAILDVLGLEQQRGKQLSPIFVGERLRVRVEKSRLAAAQRAFQQVRGVAI